MNLYYNCILRDNKMADFERRQFEIGLKFVRCNFAERNNFSEGSSELTKDAQVIRVRIRVSVSNYCAIKMLYSRVHTL